MPGQFDTDADPIIPTVTPEEAGITGGGGGDAVATVSQAIVCTTPLVPLVTGQVYDWMVSYPTTVQKITASLTEGSTDGAVGIDVKRNGTSVFSTPITIDENETTSLTADVQPSLADLDWSEGDVMTVHVTAAGVGASGLKIYPTTGAQAVDTEAPTAPANLTATADGSTTIDLAWDASDDDFGVASYRIQRSTASNFSGAVSTTVGNVTSYSMTGLNSETTYYFRVAAKDAANNQSAWSNSASDTTSGFDLETDVSWVAYLDAENLALSDGASVSTWANPGSGPDFADPASDGSTPPTFDAVNAALNGKKAVMFDDGLECLAANLGLSGACTIFAVFAKSLTGVSTAEFVWSANSGALKHYFYIGDGHWHFEQGAGDRVDEPVTDGVVQIWEYDFSPTETRVYLNGVDVTDDATNTTKPDGTVYLGKWPFNNVGSESEQPLGFWAASSGQLSSGVRLQVREALAARYGITLP